MAKYKPLGSITDTDALKTEIVGRDSPERRDVDPDDMARVLKERIKGQDHVIDGVCKRIARRWGMEGRTEPAGSSCSTRSAAGTTRCPTCSSPCSRPGT